LTDFTGIGEIKWGYERKKEKMSKTSRTNTPGQCNASSYLPVTLFLTMVTLIFFLYIYIWVFSTKSTRPAAYPPYGRKELFAQDPLDDEEVRDIRANCGAFTDVENCEKLKKQYLERREKFQRGDLQGEERKQFLQDSIQYRKLLNYTPVSQ
jgi:hypothetical protein